MVSTIVEHVRRASLFVGSSSRGRTFRPDAWVVHRLEARVRGLPHGRSRNVRTADGHVSFACEVSRLFRSYPGMDLLTGHVRSFFGLFVRVISSFSSHAFVIGDVRLVRQVRSLTLVCPPLFAVLLWIPVHPLTCWLIVARAAAISFDPSACSRVVLACGVTTTVCRSLLPHHLGLFRGWWFGFGADGMVIGPGLQKICSGWEEGREGIHPPTE